MGQKPTCRGSPETPVIFPGIPWLVNGNKYELFLESCLVHLRAQVCPEARILPPFLTKPYDPPVEFTAKQQMFYVTPKMNEIIEAFLETDATHLWFIDADGEVPPDALSKLLALDVDLASGVSPPHSSIWKSTVMKWMPPPSPEYAWSKPWFKSYRMKDVYGRIMGKDKILVTGHFCALCKRHVFDRLRFRYDPPQKIGSEIEFWHDAQKLGFTVRIRGDVLVGHLPEWPLEMLKEEYE